jgi:uncharacterized glyoxalase superfamily protein PhnB
MSASKAAQPITFKQTIYPVLRYTDVRAALDWLEKVFQLKRAMVVETFATMRFGMATIMLSSTPAEDLGLTSPRTLGASTAAIHVYVPDVDAHYEHAKANGAEIVRPLEDSGHGSRDYNARDLEGHIWAFSTYGP